MTPAYKQGVATALEKLGFRGSETAEMRGNPYPQKNQSIGAERLADLLQKDDEQPTLVSPDNSKRRSRSAPVTWGSPTTLSGLDEGQPTYGLMLPLNPRS